MSGKEGYYEKSISNKGLFLRDFYYGGVLRMQEVRGSSPLISTNISVTYGSWAPWAFLVCVTPWVTFLPG
jgi:hypothetical protein